MVYSKTRVHRFPSRTPLIHMGDSQKNPKQASRWDLWGVWEHMTKTETEVNFRGQADDQRG